MERPDFNIWHVALSVKDLEKSMEFYCQKMGFELLGLDEQESKKQAFVEIQKGGFTLELFQLKDPVSQAKLPDHIAFNCKDLKKYREYLIANGLQPPEILDFDNGVSQLRLKDPDGVELEVFQGREIYDESIRTSR